MVDETNSARVRGGLRAGAPFVLPTLVLGVSYGVLAAPVMGRLAPIAFSALVYSGAAQFASLSVIKAGGAVGAASAAGLLISLRWLPMGLAIGPSTRGHLLRRLAQGQAIVDASFALSNRGEGRFDIGVLVGATIAQAGAWVAGTVIGVFAGGIAGDPSRFGVDAVFPAFYLALLIGEVDEGRGRRPLLAAVGGGLIALTLMPFAPPGVPVIAAAAAALVGLRRT